MSAEVTRDVELPAPPAAVWEEVAERERLGDWLDADVDLELRPGGAGTFRFPDGEVRRALVRDVEPARRLAFTWWPLTGDDVGRPTTVTITIEPCDAGSRLRLVESPVARERASAVAVA
jgi:uncharacterized protein YndB with AHSA1/START domain